MLRLGAALATATLALAGMPTAAPAASPPAAAGADLPAASRAILPPTGGARVVYLTFDDGPSAYTPAILSILKAHGVHATFFQIGYAAAANPARARAVIAAGNAVGNHTWGHADLTKLGQSGILTQLYRAQAVLPRGAGHCFRPPYGATTARVRRVASTHGYRQYTWTLDPRDWTRPGSTAIVNRVVSRVRPGSIILLHDGGGNRAGTVAALRRIVPWLAHHGYRMATLTGCR